LPPAASVSAAPGPARKRLGRAPRRWRGRPPVPPDAAGPDAVAQGRPGRQGGGAPPATAPATPPAAATATSDRTAGGAGPAAAGHPGRPTGYPTVSELPGTRPAATGRGASPLLRRPHRPADEDDGRRAIPRAVGKARTSLRRNGRLAGRTERSSASPAVSGRSPESRSRRAVAAENMAGPAGSPPVRARTGTGAVVPAPREAGGGRSAVEGGAGRGGLGDAQFTEERGSRGEPVLGGGGGPLLAVQEAEAEQGAGLRVALLALPGDAQRLLLGGAGLLVPPHHGQRPAELGENLRVGVPHPGLAPQVVGALVGVDRVAVPARPAQRDGQAVEGVDLIGVVAALTGDRHRLLQVPHGRLVVAQAGAGLAD